MEKINCIEKFHNDITDTTIKEMSSPCLHIGSMAPEFIADTTFGACRLSDYKGKWLVFFSHPRRLYTSMYY